MGDGQEDSPFWGGKFGQFGFHHAFQAAAAPTLRHSGSIPMEPSAPFPAGAR